MTSLKKQTHYPDRKLKLHPPTQLTVFYIVLLVLLVVHCPGRATADKATPPFPIKERENMLTTIELYGMKDKSVLRAMSEVPRHLFVPEQYRELSYRDSPLPIGYGQTISQPFIVSEMTRLLGLSKDSRVLEVGTGSGYQAAILAQFTEAVFSIEIVEPLYEQARENLDRAGISTIRQRLGDGYYGWEEEAPFTSIIVTCAAGQIPPPLLEQLAPGGSMIIPVGKRMGTQFLILVEKLDDGRIVSKNLMPVRFVPLVRQ